MYDEGTCSGHRTGGGILWPGCELQLKAQMYTSHSCFPSCYKQRSEVLGIHTNPTSHPCFGLLWCPERDLLPGAFVTCKHIPHPLCLAQESPEPLLTSAHRSAAFCPPHTRITRSHPLDRAAAWSELTCHVRTCST